MIYNPGHDYWNRFIFFFFDIFSEIKHQMYINLIYHLLSFINHELSIPKDVSLFL